MVPQSYASNTGPPHRPRRSEPIFPELPELYAASLIKDAEDPQASFYTKSSPAVRSQLYGRPLLSDYVTTGSFNRRLTWNPKTGQWEDTSEPGFTCDPATVPSLIPGCIV